MVSYDTGAERNRDENWPLLALLRFVLASGVAGYHLGKYGVTSSPFAVFAFLGGIPAIVSFLVVSGYSIAHSIDVHPQGYFSRRFLRIYPIYISILVLVVIPSQLCLYSQPSLSTYFHLFRNIIPLNGILWPTLTAYSPSWSLTVEIVFYLLAPFFLKSNRGAIFCMLASVGFMLSHHGYRAADYVGLGIEGILLWTWLTGWIYYFHRDHILARVWLAFAPALLFSLFGEDPGVQNLPPILLTSFVLLFLDRLKLPARLVPLCNYLGELSYPLYLAHTPVYVFTWYLLSSGSGSTYLLVNNGLVYGIAIIGATLFFYHCIDAQVRRPRASLDKTPNASNSKATSGVESALS